MHTGTVRAGLISLLVPALCCLWAMGFSDLSRIWLFIIMFAICFVLMMQSMVDLFVLAFGFASMHLGRVAGRTLVFVRRRSENAAKAA